MWVGLEWGLVAKMEGSHCNMLMGRYFMESAKGVSSLWVNYSQVLTYGI